jgi:hypothetical protein
MKITEEAKTMITEALKSNDCDCLQAKLQQSCCGTSLVFTLTKLESGKKPITIDGVSVFMDDETQERAKTVTIAVENGKLVIHDDKPSCCCC